MSTDDKTLQTILDKLETLSGAVTTLARDVDALKDSKEARAFFSINGRRGIPEMPQMRKAKIHPDVYFAFDDSTDVFRCRNLQEFAALYELEYRHGIFGGIQSTYLSKNKAQILHTEALYIRFQLKRRGINLVMFSHYLSDDYQRVPYVELFEPYDRELENWIRENDCVINNVTKDQEEKEVDDRDPKKRLDKCRKCEFCRETAEKAIRCSRHKASVPKYYTKRDVRNYLESARNVCEFPKCFKPKETAVEQTDA